MAQEERARCQPAVVLQRRRSKWLKTHKRFLLVCSYWAAVSDELNMPVSRRTSIIDRATLIWSFVIVFTTMIKFIQVSDQTAAAAASPPANQSSVPPAAELSYKNLLTLNYLPRMNDFGKLYYGLMSVAIGCSFVWRLYLCFKRARGRRQAERANPLIRLRFNPTYELIHFFMNGPRAQESQAAGAGSETSSSPPWSSFDDSPKDSRWSKSFDSDSLGLSLIPAKLPRQTELLTRAHSRRQFRAAGHQLDQRPPTGQPEHGHSHTQLYNIPIGAMDYLHDQSRDRWRFLARSFYLFTLSVFVCACPLTALVVVGLKSVRGKFTGFWPAADQPPDSSWAALLGPVMVTYGMLEQLYAIMQTAMFFIFTNLFITLFHADLLYKSRPILRELQLIFELYRTQSLGCVTKAELSLQKLRLWAFFDYIQLLDDFIAKYGIISMATIVIGVSFGQSYLKVEDPALKAGTAAALFSNFLSFTFLHLISWNIEQLSTPIQKTILAILAREPNYEMKREWQRTLFGFFQSDFKRTFTLGGRYPMNLRSYFKTIFGLLTMSLVINRLFHKRSWDLSFAYAARTQPPAS